MYRSYYPKRRGKSKVLILIITGIILIIAIILSFVFLPKVASYLERQKIESDNQKTIEEIQDIQSDTKTIDSDEEVGVKKATPIDIERGATPQVVIEDKAYLEVPFICQAPLQTEANWVYHEESCEEAAFLQVDYYVKGIQNVNKQTAHEEILDMLDWQVENLGSHHDLYGDDMKEFIVGYSEYSDDEVKVIKNAEIEDIKLEISRGNPVIVPIMGDLLQNPYYPYPGYHMLTVIGYTEDRIITNDVGTRRGKDFSYSYDRFYSAMEAAGAEILVILL